MTRVCGIADEKALRRFALGAGVSQVEISGGCATINAENVRVSSGRIGRDEVVRLCAGVGKARSCETFRKRDENLGTIGFLDDGTHSQIGDVLVIIGAMILARALWGGLTAQKFEGASAP